MDYVSYFAKWYSGHLSLCQVKLLLPQFTVSQGNDDARSPVTWKFKPDLNWKNAVWIMRKIQWNTLLLYISKMFPEKLWRDGKSSVSYVLMSVPHQSAGRRSD